MTRSASGYEDSYIQRKVQASAQNTNIYPFKIGQGVRHQKFGEGVVVSYEGNADSLVIKINFGSNGLKTLAMEYAKLEKI